MWNFLNTFVSGDKADRDVFFGLEHVQSWLTNSADSPTSEFLAKILMEHAKTKEEACHMSPAGVVAFMVPAFMMCVAFWDGRIKKEDLTHAATGFESHFIGSVASEILSLIVFPLVHRMSDGELPPRDMIDTILQQIKERFGSRPGGTE